MNSTFPRSPPAFCGEYTQALIGLYSIVSRGPPQISTPPQSSYSARVLVEGLDLNRQPSVGSTRLTISQLIACYAPETAEIIQNCRNRPRLQRSYYAARGEDDQQTT